MAFPDSFVEEVRRTADIVRYISEHVSLRKMGTSWKGLCPFHQEKTPSFNVRQDPPVFHCFGCGEGGDVFKFVMLHERVPFPEAIEVVLFFRALVVDALWSAAGAGAGALAGSRADVTIASMLGAGTAGLVLGGSIRQLAEIHLRWWPLALVGLALQLAPIPSMKGQMDHWLAVGLLIASYVVLLAFVVMATTGS